MEHEQSMDLRESAMKKIRIATTWLDGCSGCHMSLLDIDQQLATLAELVELVYSPLVDTPDVPEAVDVAIVEGAVGTEADQHKLHRLRACSRLLVALGDCAVTGNVSAMRNRWPVEAILDQVYGTHGPEGERLPNQGVPRLLEQARPLHAYVAVDAFLPGCPPASEAISFLLTELLEGRVPEVAGKSRFGA